MKASGGKEKKMEVIKPRERIAISVSDAAALLGVSVKTAYQLTHRADFPSFKVGNRTVISVKALDAWALKQAMGEGAQA